MAKRNISFTKPPEPSFIKKMKESIGYQEPDTIETKMKMADYDPDDDVDHDDEQPVIVVLKPGDISEEDLKKIENQADEDKKIVFAKPAKKATEEKNSLDFSSKKRKDLQKRIDSEKDKTKKIYVNKYQRLLGIVRLKNHALSVISPTTSKKSSKVSSTTSNKSSMLGYGVWNNEMEAQLIKLIKKQRHLWDSNHRLYSKKYVKRQSYQIMAKYMRSRWPEHGTLFTADALLGKFSKLRSYYKRELKKLKLINSQSGFNMFKPQWVHFSTMSFLDNELSTTQDSSDLDLSEISSLDIDEFQSIVEMPSIKIDTIRSLQPCIAKQEDALKIEYVKEDTSQVKNATGDVSPSYNVGENFSQSNSMIENFSHLNGMTADFSESENETEEFPQSNSEAEDISHSKDITEDFSQYKQACSNGSVNHRLKTVEVPKIRNKFVNVDSTFQNLASTTDKLQQASSDKDANEAFGRYVGLTLGSMTDECQKELAKIEIIKVLIKYKFNK